MAFETAETFIYRSEDVSDNAENGKVLPDVRRSIAEEYLNARCNIHLHVGFGTEEYCANFNIHSEIISSRDTATELSRNRQGLAEGATRDKQVSVLIRVAQNLELPEVPPVVIDSRTVARLKPIHDGAYCVGHPAELSPLLSLIADGVVENRELISGVGGITFGQDKLPDKVVERGAGVVEHLPDKHIEASRHGRNMVEAADLISRLIIDIFGNDIGFEVTEGRDVLAKRLDMFVSPVILSNGTVQRSHYEKLQEDSEDAQGPRDSDSHERGIRGEPRQGNEASEGITASKPVQVESQTAPSRHGGYSAKHTHLGSPEDA